MEPWRLTAHEAAEKMRAGEVSAAELTRAVVERIGAVNPDIHAYLHVSEDYSLDAANGLGQPNGDPLWGVPVAVKDNICTVGMPTTCASRILEGFMPPYDATVVQRLLGARMVPVGKTNLDEFAMGSSTENSAFGTTANPWDRERVPGGSSGGSAAAVAADAAICALGSDTGGSIRQPAALCGIVGLKPTYGLVSRYGLVAFASSLDQIGPLTKDVRDAALLLQVIAGHDGYDSTSIDYAPPDYASVLGRDLKGLKAAVPKELFGEGFQPGVRGAVSAALRLLESLGMTVEEISLPSLEYALSAYYLIAPSECSSNLARFDGVRYGYRSSRAEDIVEMYKHTRAEGLGTEVKRRIMLGTYALSAGYYEAYYGQAQKVRTLIINDFDRAFADYDVLVSPTTPTTAFKIGEKAADPLQMYLSDICTIPTNLAGIPAISIPCGLADGLPVGLQIMGKHLDEPTVLRVAYALEQEIKFERKTY